MKKILYPGSFDPLTFGHLNIIQKAAKLFDFIYVGVAINTTKQPMFSIEQRIQFLKSATSAISNVEIIPITGLVVDSARDKEVCAILRSIRNSSDFDTEELQARMNRKLGNIDTLYLLPDEPFEHVSSTYVKEIALLGGEVSAFVPKDVAIALAHR